MNTDETKLNNLFDDVLPSSSDLFTYEIDRKEVVKGKQPQKHVWSESEINFMVSSFSRTRYMSNQEITQLVDSIRKGNTPSHITKWIKGVRAQQRKMNKLEKHKKRDARFTKAI
eukprot:TRINITY_DN495_c0_g1_i1.p1 TRINITY_DN495_c0_g1~~TRINITY_DN495_c0_g1_i1.p1  ORF type:complete len:114 (+),score=19.49 TRINITY_DN495_c0_g1_i1:295-636(+)